MNQPFSPAQPFQPQYQPNFNQPMPGAFNNNQPMNPYINQQQRF